MSEQECLDAVIRVGRHRIASKCKYCDKPRAEFRIGARTFCNEQCADGYLTFQEKQLAFSEHVVNQIRSLALTAIYANNIEDVPDISKDPAVLAAEFLFSN